MKKESLSPKQLDAIAHLVEEETVTEAARLTGVSRTTLYSWLKMPRFRAELELARRSELEARMNALRGLVPKALFALEGLLESADQKVRLKAATEVVKAAHALLAQAPPSEAVPLFAGNGAESEPLDAPEDLPGLARVCVERLLSGSLEPRAAQMLPSYLRLMERLDKDEPRPPHQSRPAHGGWDDEESDEEFLNELLKEGEPQFLADYITKPLQFDASGNPRMAAYQETVMEIFRRVGEGLEDEKADPPPAPEEEGL
jgi:transposase-like protein